MNFHVEGTRNLLELDKVSCFEKNSLFLIKEHIFTSRKYFSLSSEVFAASIVRKPYLFSIVQKLKLPLVPTN